MKKASNLNSGDRSHHEVEKVESEIDQIIKDLPYYKISGRQVRSSREDFLLG